MQLEAAEVQRCLAKAFEIKSEDDCRILIEFLAGNPIPAHLNLSRELAEAIEFAENNPTWIND